MSGVLFGGRGVRVDVIIEVFGKIHKKKIGGGGGGGGVGSGGGGGRVGGQGGCD